MGVTFARKVAKGGFVFSDDKPYYVGPSLTSRINTFIGIAGRNWGISYCN